MATRTRPTVNYGPELFTVTIVTSDNSLARCLFGAFGGEVRWCPDRETATITVDMVGVDTIGLIASMGPVAITGIIKTSL